MKRSMKITIGVALGIVVVAGIALAVNSEFLQGRLSRNAKPLPAYNENTCSDSDGGQIYETKGTTYVKTNTISRQTQYADYCDGDTLVEYYCDGSKIKSENKKTNDKEDCSSGKIVQKKESIKPHVDSYKSLISSNDIAIIQNKYGKDVFKKSTITADFIENTWKTPLTPNYKKTFKVAFVAINNGLPGGGFDNDEIKGIDNIRKALPIVFQLATYSQATLDTSSPVVTIYTDYWLDPLGTQLKDVTKTFYENNPDDFDFIYVYQKSDQYRGLYNTVRALNKCNGCDPFFAGEEKNDPCQQCYDKSESYGSNSKLAGVIQINVLGNEFPDHSDYGSSYYEYINVLYSLDPDSIKSWETAFGVGYLNMNIALHEIEHAWSFHITIPENSQMFETMSPANKTLLKKFTAISRPGHFSMAVQSGNSMDPFDALQFDVTPDNRIKICPENLPPKQPYRFHDFVLYSMGLDDNLDFNKQYKFINYKDYEDTPDEELKITIDDFKDGCFFYKYSSTEENPTYTPFIDSITLNDIAKIWDNNEECEQN